MRTLRRLPTLYSSTTVLFHGPMTELFADAEQSSNVVADREELVAKIDF
jgi:hypothetical protein